MKTYTMNKVDADQMGINGKANHPLWDTADVLNDFSSPWFEQDTDNMEFRALHDGDNLYVSYKVQDHSLHLDCTDDSKKSVDNSDRVELFLRADKNLDPYYCLEIDPMARVQDFIARPNRAFDYQWDWPKQDITVKSHSTPTGFSVEIAISIASLKRFGLIQNDGVMEAGVFRAKYYQQDNGQFEPTWITWVNPKTESPDFHTASAFGKFQLDDFTPLKTE